MQILNNYLLREVILFAIMCTVCCKRDWSIELVKIEIENLTPDVLIVDLHKSKISRGVYAISGIIDFKEDITDALRMETTVFLSRTGSNGSYVKTALLENDFTFSEFAEKIYKTYLLDTFSKCAENYWRYTGIESMPLTKRIMKLQNCNANTNKWPSHLLPGYYRFVDRYSNQANGTVVFDLIISAN